MSWAAHNPEKYSEICRKGIKKKMCMLAGLEMSDEVDSFIDDWLWSLESDNNKDSRKAFEHLLSLSHQEVSNAEADHFSSLANV